MHTSTKLFVNKTSKMSSQLITSDNDAFFLTGPISYLCSISSGSCNQMSTDLPLFYLIPMVLACFCSCQCRGLILTLPSRNGYLCVHVKIPWSHKQSQSFKTESAGEYSHQCKLQVCIVNQSLLCC